VSTEILTLDEIVESQANKYLTHNTALRQIEAKTIRVISRTTSAQPATPTAGDTYIVPASATGDDWSGEDGKLAHYYNSAWAFYTPFEGQRLWVNDEDDIIVYDGSSWTAFADIYASVDSPALTGTPTAPTAAAGTNTTQIATTEFVSTAVSNLIDSAPDTLDTLNEIAAAINDDPDFYTTVSAKMSDVVDDTTPQLGGDLDTNGNDILVATDDKIILGDTGFGDQLEIYTDSGNTSYIKKSTGELFIQSDEVTFEDQFSVNTHLKLAQDVGGSYVELYYNGTKVAETISGGFSADALSASGLAYPTSDGSSGQAIITNGSGSLSFGSFATTAQGSNADTAYGWGDHASAGYATYPSQTGNSGKYLTTNGSVTSWATVDALPDQTGNSGKYLTTDGSDASWAVLDTDANTTTKGLYEMANTISSNYSITSGNNAMSAGPITVDSGVSVTVPSGSVWTIV
jgi:hypothetical protein